MKLTITKIKETCLYVNDLDQTRAFYEGKLGLKCIAHKKDRHVFFRVGETVLLCFISDTTKHEADLPPHWGKGALHYAFECPKEQYDDWRKKVSDAGIEITHDHVWGSGGKSFYFKDPDGHVGEIVQPGIWGD